MNAHYIENAMIDSSKRYRFNPLEDGLCQTTTKGKIVLNRRLATMILGINFPKTYLKVIHESQDNNLPYELVLQPTSECQPDRTFVRRYRQGALLELNNLFYRLNVKYKEFQYLFISEPVQLDTGVMGIRLRLKDILPLDSRLVSSYASETSVIQNMYELIQAKGGTQASEMKRLKELEEENRQLKLMYAELCLKNEFLKEALAKPNLQDQPVVG